MTLPHVVNGPQCLLQTCYTRSPKERVCLANKLKILIYFCFIRGMDFAEFHKILSESPRA